MLRNEYPRRLVLNQFLAVSLGSAGRSDITKEPQMNALGRFRSVFVRYDTLNLSDGKRNHSDSTGWKKSWIVCICICCVPCHLFAFDRSLFPFATNGWSWQRQKRYAYNALPFKAWSYLASSSLFRCCLIHVRTCACKPRHVGFPPTKSVMPSRVWQYFPRSYRFRASLYLEVTTAGGFFRSTPLQCGGGSCNSCQNRLSRTKSAFTRQILRSISTISSTFNTPGTMYSR